MPPAMNELKFRIQFRIGFNDLELQGSHPVVVDIIAGAGGKDEDWILDDQVLSGRDMEVQGQSHRVGLE